MKVEEIHGRKDDNDGGKPEPKHVPDIVPSHTLPSFHFGQHRPLFRLTLGRAHEISNGVQKFWFRVARKRGKRYPPLSPVCLEQHYKQSF
jgi:hypothetical protein